MSHEREPNHRPPPDEELGEVTVPPRGPFEFAPEQAPWPDARHAGVLVSEALIDGPTTERAAAALGTWWSAAGAVLDACPEDRFELDVRPHAFRIGDGQWHFTSRGAWMRFHIPRPVIAFKALLVTLEDEVLARRWLPGVSPWAPLGAVVGELMERIGMHYDDATLAIYIELEIDILRRSGQSTRTAEALRAEQQQRVARPLLAAIEWLPREERRRAAQALVDYAGELATRSTAEEVPWLARSAAVELAASGIKIQELRAQLDAARGPATAHDGR